MITVMAAQRPDIICLNDKQLELYTNPLEDYWNTRKKKRPAFNKTEDCKRGYIASWVIKEKQLLLNNIDATIERKMFLFFKKSIKCSLRHIFSRVKHDFVKAMWFSGKLRIPYGKMTEYVHEGYGSHFEKELIITVEKGNIIKEVMLDYTQQRLVVTSLT